MQLSGAPAIEFLLSTAYSAIGHIKMAPLELSMLTRISILVFLTVTSFIGLSEEAELYPFGPSHGDEALPKVNDNATRFDLKQNFPYGLKNYDHIFISDNGVLSFDDPVFVELDQPLFRNLPFYYDLDGDGSFEDPDTILPFWADVDISGIDSGDIYFRESSDADILERATSYVKANFPAFSFSATQVVIVTWFDVSFYDQSGARDPRNTFQAVLVSDGDESYTIFIYEKIEWMIGTRMGGDADTGLLPDLGRGVAVVGFTAGDGTATYKLDVPNPIQLPNLSNTPNQELGVQAFRVDGSRAEPPLCPSINEINIVIEPSFGGMMGGEKIRVFSPFLQDRMISACRFEKDGRVLQEVPAWVQGDDEVICVPEPFYETGAVHLTLEVEECLNVLPQIYEIVAVSQVEPMVLPQFRSTDSQRWEDVGDTFNVTWKQTLLNGSQVYIGIMSFIEDSYGGRWVTVVRERTDNVGQFSFSPPYNRVSMSYYNVTASEGVGIIRVSSDSYRDPVLWSEVHALTYLFPEAYQTNPAQWSSNSCRKWIEIDSTLPAFIDGLEDCPCTEEQARADIGRFISYTPDNSASCFLNTLIRANGTGGLTCCYDSQGHLTHFQDVLSAGRSSRSHLRQSTFIDHVDGSYRPTNVPELSHWLNDELPFRMCCNWAENDTDCLEFRRARPSKDCVGYLPPVPAATFGDPHFITVDGFKFTFNGAGEFILLRYVQNEITLFELQGQLELAPSVNDAKATILTGVAMTTKGGDIVNIGTWNDGDLNVTVAETSSGSSNPVLFNQMSSHYFQGGLISVQEYSDNMHLAFSSLLVTFEQYGIGIEVSSDNGALSIIPVISSSIGLEDLVGLLDDEASDVLQIASPQQIHEYGELWAVPEGQSLFFTHKESPPFTPTYDISLPDYESCNMNYECLFDYAVTGDAHFAANTLKEYEQFEEKTNALQKVEVCPYLPPPVNGNKTYVDDSVRQYEGAEVIFACGEGTVLTGSSKRVCTRVSNTSNTLAWTGSSEDTACIPSACGPVPPPENGYVIVDTSGMSAEVFCDEGYYIENPNGNLTCISGNWDKAPPNCFPNGFTTENTDTTEYRMSRASVASELTTDITEITEPRNTDKIVTTATPERQPGPEPWVIGVIAGFGALILLVLVILCLVLRTILKLKKYFESQTSGSQENHSNGTALDMTSFAKRASNNYDTS